MLGAMGEEPEQRSGHVSHIGPGRIRRPPRTLRAGKELPQRSRKTLLLRGLEQLFWQSGLPNNGLQSAYPKLWMIWNRHGDGRAVLPLLHHDMTAATPHLDEAV